MKYLYLLLLVLILAPITLSAQDQNIRDYGIEIESLKEHFTTVKIILPKIN